MVVVASAHGVFAVKYVRYMTWVAIPQSTLNIGHQPCANNFGAFNFSHLSPHHRASSARAFKADMSSNVGLSTPRGSGTSGYVQRNLSHIKPRDRGIGAPYNVEDFQRHKQRKPDAEILEHERKRAIELKVFELRDRLEEEG